ncbi:hypothetical protein GPX89_42305 [Nocardia sp. ET3-3]|uniref:HTH luxR-type domain-containing protein n=1 Tax=Nocardia terrae TaxID=2675851 RepID=A0A7K1VBJ5_9NOCA|nr:hypothetical protein [Nocardia terrae]MVU83849.1 hypothetical protein [Nocardia terrae]
MSGDLADLLVRSRELLDSALSRIDSAAGAGEITDNSPVTPREDWGETLLQRLRGVRDEVTIAISNPIRARREFVAADALLRELIDGGKRVRMLVYSRYADDHDLEELLRDRTFSDRIRVTHNTFHNTMVIDDRLAVVWTQANGKPQAYFATEFTLLGAIQQFANQTWETALPLRDHVALRRRGFDEMAIAVLRLLNAGVTDEVAARRLSVSTRTYRRYLADVMIRLNAATRFQLGARAAELGLLKAESA